MLPQHPERPVQERVVITGMGCIAAAGNTPDSVLDALENGIVMLRSAHYLGEYALPYPFFAIEDAYFAPARRFSALDTLQLARYAAHAAINEAGLTATDIHNMPIIVGTTAGSSLHFLRSYALSRGGVCPPGDNAFAPPVPPIKAKINDKAEYLTSNIALALVPKSHGVRLTLTNACTSGADAIGLGLDMIRQGVQCVLCGGADALSIVPHTGFARLMIYADTPCRPFDVGRKGLNLGEGAAMLVLEAEHHARARGARILGAVLGYGAAADAHHFTAPHPEGRGLAKAIAIALADAHMTMKDLAFVTAHGTATPENDKVEGRVLHNLSHCPPVWGSKGGTGHTLGAAGALEAVLSVQALRRQRVPVSLGFSTVDPAIGLVPTTVTLPLQKKRALSTSLGFGGGNAALIVEGVC